jgi:hypothetical protein
MTEAQIQETVARLLDSLGLLWCHVPNGEWRDIKTAKRLKAMGVKRGVPDILIFDAPRSGGIGLALELKTTTGRLSDEQEVWLDDLEARGWMVKSTRGLGDALHIIRREYPRMTVPGPHTRTFREPLEVAPSVVAQLFEEE